MLQKSRGVNRASRNDFHDSRLHVGLVPQAVSEDSDAHARA